MAVKLNDQPKVAIFLSETEYSDYIKIMIDGQKWMVEQKHTRIIKEEACL